MSCLKLVEYARIKAMKRIAALDLVRTVAIGSVVFCHAIELFLPADVPEMLASHPLAYIIYIASLLLGRVGVPLFLFLTGYLLLSRDYSRGGVNKFYRQHLLPLLICWEIWVLILNFFLACWSGEVDLGLYVRNALFLEEVHIGMAWFMPMVLGMYLFLPWVAMVLRQMRGRQLLALMVVVYVWSFIVPNVGWFSGALGQPLETTLDLGFGGGMYGLYLVLGYCFRRYERRWRRWLRRPRRKLALAGLAMGLFLVTILAQGTLHELGGEYFYWYQLAMWPVITGVVFLLLAEAKIRSARLKRGLENVATCAFGVYLLHQPVQWLVAICLPVAWGVWLRVGIVWLVSAGVSLGAVTLARRISLPEVRRAVFYLK